VSYVRTVYFAKVTSVRRGIFGDKDLGRRLGRCKVTRGPPVRRQNPPGDAMYANIFEFGFVEHSFADDIWMNCIVEKAQDVHGHHPIFCALRCVDIDVRDCLAAGLVYPNSRASRE